MSSWGLRRRRRPFEDAIWPVECCCIRCSLWVSEGPRQIKLTLFVYFYVQSKYYGTADLFLGCGEEAVVAVDEVNDPNRIRMNYIFHLVCRLAPTGIDGFCLKHNCHGHPYLFNSSGQIVWTIIIYMIPDFSDSWENGATHAGISGYADGSVCSRRSIKRTDEPLEMALLVREGSKGVGGESRPNIFYT